jgi:hypothetical protein
MRINVAGTVESSRKHRKEPSVSTNDNKFLGWLSKHQLLKNDSVP